MIYGTPTSYCVSRCVWFFFLLHFASLNVPKKNHWWLNDNRIIVNKQTNKQNYYTKQIYVRYYCCCPKIFLSWFLLVFCYFHPLNKHIGWIFLFLSVSNNWCFFFTSLIIILMSNSSDSLAFNYFRFDSVVVVLVVDFLNLCPKMV